MIVMGLDLSTNSGWAVRDSAMDRASTECGVISVADYTWEEKYAIFAIRFLPLIRRFQPDFVAIERPEHGVRQFERRGKPDLIGDMPAASTINPAALQLTGIAGAALAVCTLMDIPWGTIAANAWRPVYFGQGFRPEPVATRNRTTAEIKLGRPDWKQAAIDACMRDGIRLPVNRKDQKDAAEAVAIGACWARCEVPRIVWMQKRFMELRSGAFRKEAA